MFGDYTGSRFERWQVSNLAYSADVSTSEAKDHDLFLKKSPEMRSGQISLERLRRDELDLPKNLSGMHVGDRFQSES